MSDSINASSDYPQLQVVESRCRVAVSEKEDLEAKVMEVEKERRASDKKNHLQQIKLSKIAAELKEEKEVWQSYIYNTCSVFTTTFPGDIGGRGNSLICPGILGESQVSRNSGIIISILESWDSHKYPGILG